MEQKSKYAVLIYPDFSLQEITCLTSALTVWFGEKIDILASERKPYSSEEGFQVTPAKTVDEADPAGYACVILPGTVNPLPALFDEKLIGFLRRGKGTDTLFAAISSSPAPLCKAGLLTGRTSPPSGCFSGSLPRLCSTGWAMTWESVSWTPPERNTPRRS